MNGPVVFITVVSLPLGPLHIYWVLLMPWALGIQIGNKTRATEQNSPYPGGTKEYGSLIPSTDKNHV